MFIATRRRLRQADAWPCPDEAAAACVPALAIVAFFAAIETPSIPTLDDRL